MEDSILWVAAGLLVLFQLMTCIYAKKAWLRWVPFLVSVGLMLFCFVMYMVSDQTNWGYIILMGLLGVLLLIQGAVILVNRLIRWIMKR